MQTPWSQIESEHIIKLSILLSNSYKLLTGRDLEVSASNTDLAKTLYYSEKVILAHDGTENPCFTYANVTAQRLWEIPWNDFIGMPSKYSAEADERSQRQKLLNKVSEQGFIDDYQGIRISKSGKRFFIQGVTVWNLLKDNQKCGQAAAFNKWQFL